MNLAEQIIAIILSVFLAIFLVLAITVLVLVVKLIKKVNRIVATAETVRDNAEAAAATLREASGPLALLKIIRNITRTVNDRKGKKKGEK
jgi:hypothetical protein